jgi:3-methyladenine DNA glycosylase/8-oxoguanine DNA glycosylase
MDHVLKARLPFSLSAVIYSHGWIQLSPFVEDADKRGFSYVLELETGKAAEIKVREAVGGVSFETNEPLTGVELGELTNKLIWMLGLDQDFSEFYNLASKEPKMARAIKASSGRILRSATIFEDIIKTILTTNTLWAATKRMTNNLVSQFGALVEGNSERKAFPTPARLAKVTEEELRTMTRLGYRAPYIVELARRVSSGELDLEALKNDLLTTQELRKKLLAIKGIGPYASANLLMLLGHYDFIPVDTWAVKVVSYEWHEGKPIGSREVEAAFEPWGKWKGLVYWLWDWSYRNNN